MYEVNDTQYLVPNLKPYTQYVFSLVAYNVKYNLSSASIDTFETTAQAGKFFMWYAYSVHWNKIKKYYAYALVGCNYINWNLYNVGKQTPNSSIEGQEKNKIHLPSGSVNFCFHLHTLRLISLAHWATKLLFLFALAQILPALGSQTWVFPCTAMAWKMSDILAQNACSDYVALPCSVFARLVIDIWKKKNNNKKKKTAAKIQES